LQRSCISQAKTALSLPIIRPNAEGRTVSKDVAEACKAIALTSNSVNDREDIICGADNNNQSLTLIINAKIRCFK
jgi:hypothetical protein